MPMPLPMPRPWQPWLHTRDIISTAAEGGGIEWSHSCFGALQKQDQTPGIVSSPVQHSCAKPGLLGQPPIRIEPQRSWLQASHVCAFRVQHNPVPCALLAMYEDGRSVELLRIFQFILSAVSRAGHTAGFQPAGVSSPGRSGHPVSHTANTWQGLFPQPGPQAGCEF